MQYAAISQEQSYLDLKRFIHLLRNKKINSFHIFYIYFWVKTVFLIYSSMISKLISVGWTKQDIYYGVLWEHLQQLVDQSLK